MLTARGEPVRRTIISAALCLYATLFGCGGNTAITAPPTPTAPPSPAVFTVQADASSPLLTAAQRTAMGFQYGPPDGTVGVLRTGSTYSFFMAARSSSACSGTPAVQGTYRLGGTTAGFTQPYGCSAEITTGNDPNGYTFDQNYAGGGPVLAVTGAGGATGVLHIYHGEAHGGSCSTSGFCTYSSLGMAFSKDGGATFTKLGEVIQPYLTRSAILRNNLNLDVGGGTLVVADGQGQHIANGATVNSSDTYLYVFYSDRDPSAATGTACNQTPCLAVARAPLATVVADAFAGTTSAFPTLFKKFYNGAFTEPRPAATPTPHSTPGTTPLSSGLRAASLPYSSTPPRSST